MKKRNLLLMGLTVALTLVLLSSASSDSGTSSGVMDQIKSSAFGEVDIFTGNETDTNSTIEEKLYEEMDDFYSTLEDLFVGYRDSNATSWDANATSYNLGDYEFYFGTTEEGVYYFGDGEEWYFINDVNGTLPNSAAAHLEGSLPTLEKIIQALEEGKTGRAFGLLTSCGARMKATEKHLGKVEERKLRKEERETEMQEKREEREEKIQEKREERERKNKEEKDKKEKKEKEEKDKKEKKEKDKKEKKEKDKDNNGKGKGRDNDEGGE